MAASLRLYTDADSGFFGICNQGVQMATLYEWPKPDGDEIALRLYWHSNKYSTRKFQSNDSPFSTQKWSLPNSEARKHYNQDYCIADLHK